MKIILKIYLTEIWIGFSWLNMFPASDKFSGTVTEGLFISQLQRPGRLYPGPRTGLSENVRKPSASFLPDVKLRRQLSEEHDRYNRWGYNFMSQFISRELLDILDHSFLTKITIKYASFMVRYYYHMDCKIDLFIWRHTNAFLIFLNK
jgi:hypothetical protein